jgi:pimeloyl-ACP methyl ester carboxylesterase
MTDARRFTLALPDGPMAGLAFGDQTRPVDAIFLHATGFNASTYRQGLSAAARQLHVLALDQRGHGLSGLATDPETLSSWSPFAQDLIHALDALDLTRPVVLSGHSMGGAVSTLAAAELGERVKGLVLVDPVFMRAPQGMNLADSPLVVGARRRRRDFASKAAALEAYLGRGAFRSWPAEAVADYVEDGFRPVGDGVTLTCAPEWEAAIFQVSTRRDPRPALDALTCPVSILRAEFASTCILDGAVYVDPFPERRMTTVAGSSHFLPMEQPDLIASALIEACA